MRSWLILLTVCLVSTAAADELTTARTVTLDKDEPAPFSGLLMPRIDAEAIAVMLMTYEERATSLASCQKLLDEERDRGRRFYRRMSFWIPVACITFTAGLGLGVWSR